MASIETLAEAIRNRQAILFAGAGLSMSVGLPSWADLIAHMCHDVGLPNSPQAAWTYQTLAEFHRLKHGSIGPLRSWMDRNWSVSAERVQESEIHSIIVELDFPLIYTTNYDNNIEIAYDIHNTNYLKISKTSDIARIRSDITQIVKFHGDFEDDKSLVIAERDYFERLMFETPLDIKFKADALGKTLLFIGHSVTDLNIRMLLYRLWQIWKKSGSERDRPSSFVFMTRKDMVQDAVLENWGITVLHEDAENPHESALKFLRRLKNLVCCR